MMEVAIPVSVYEPSGTYLHCEKSHLLGGGDCWLRITFKVSDFSQAVVLLLTGWRTMRQFDCCTPAFSTMSPSAYCLFINASVHAPHVVALNACLGSHPLRSGFTGLPCVLHVELVSLQVIFTVNRPALWQADHSGCQFHQAS